MARGRRLGVHGKQKLPAGSRQLYAGSPERSS